MMQSLANAADVSAAHRVLAIYELTTNILSYSDIQSRARLSLVSQGLETVSLDCLWHTLPGIEPIVHLITLHSLEFTRENLSKIGLEPSRVTYYTQRVRAIEYEDGADELDATLDSRLGKWLLPNLQTITWRPRTELSVAFLTPLVTRTELKEFKMHWSADTVMDSITGLFNEISTQMLVNLHSIDLSHVPGKQKGPWWLKSPANVVTALKEMLENMHHLLSVSLSFNLLTTSVIQSLGALRRLVTLRLTLYFPTHRHVLESLQRNTSVKMFPVLEELVIDSSVGAANMLLRCVASQTMRKVDICTQVLDKASEVRSLFGLICKWRTMRELKVLIERSHNFSSSALNPQLHKILAETGPELYRVQAESWKLLLVCVELRVMQYTSIVPPVIGNDILKEMANKWPKLRELVITPLPISVFHIDNPNQLSLDVLAALAKGCPALYRVELDIQPIWRCSLLRSQGEERITCTLLHLSVGWAEWRDNKVTPISVAKYIKGLFPMLEKLSWNGGSDLPVGRTDDEEMKSYITRYLWAEVLRIMPNAAELARADEKNDGEVLSLGGDQDKNCCKTALNNNLQANLAQWSIQL